MVKKYFCHDGTILLSYLFCLIKACAILKKRRRCVRMIAKNHSNTPSFAIKRVSLFLLRRGIVWVIVSPYINFALAFAEKVVA